MASVRFSGQLREEANASPESFSEVLHLSKPLNDSCGWAVAGIQQSLILRAVAGVLTECR
jgi:predicted lipid-binding transport protein (Tim44 family)